MASLQPAHRPHPQVPIIHRPAPSPVATAYTTLHAVISVPTLKLLPLPAYPIIIRSTSVISCLPPQYRMSIIIITVIQRLISLCRQLQTVTHRYIIIICLLVYSRRSSRQSGILFKIYPCCDRYYLYIATRSFCDVHSLLCRKLAWQHHAT